MTPATPEDTTPEESAPDQSAAPEAPASEAPETPEDDIRRKYLQALALKHGKSGASSTSRGPAASQGHASQNTRQSRMFRRKSGG